jgi:hypothetical protein
MNGEEEKQVAIPKKSYEQIEREERERRFRYMHRRSVDELIQPILNLEIIEMHADDNLEFMNVPSKFESFE